MFVPCRQRLAVDTPIRLQLLYADGRLAIEGRGRVLSYSDRPLPGLDLALQWTDPFISLVRWCRSRSVSVPPVPVDPRGLRIPTEISQLNPSVDTTALIADLLPPASAPSVPPSPSRLSGARWLDEDEPLSEHTPPPGYGPLPAAHLEGDEPLLAADLVAAASRAPVAPVSPAHPFEEAEAPPPPDEGPAIVLLPPVKALARRDRVDPAERADGADGADVETPEEHDADTVGAADVERVGSADGANRGTAAPFEIEAPVDQDAIAALEGVVAADPEAPPDPEPADSEDATTAAGAAADTAAADGAAADNATAASAAADTAAAGAAGEDRDSDDATPWADHIDAVDERMGHGRHQFADESPDGEDIFEERTVADVETTSGEYAAPIREVRGWRPDGTGRAESDRVASRPERVISKFGAPSLDPVGLSTPSAPKSSSVALRSSVPARTAKPRAETPPGSGAVFVRQSVLTPDLAAAEEEATRVEASESAPASPSSPPVAEDLQDQAEALDDAAGASNPVDELPSWPSVAELASGPYEWDDDESPSPTADLFELIVLDPEPEAADGGVRSDAFEGPVGDEDFEDPSLEAELVDDDQIEPLDDDEDETIVDTSTPAARMRAAGLAALPPEPDPDPTVARTPVPTPAVKTQPEPSSPGPAAADASGRDPSDGPAPPGPNEVVIAEPVDVSALEAGALVEEGGDALLLAEGPKPLSSPSGDLPKGVVRLEAVEDDEALPAPAPARSGEFSVRSMGRTPDGDREPGEVTPLARIALVRRPAYERSTNSVPPTAIPSKRHRPALPAPSRRAVGVDLGTSTTAMALMRGGTPELIPSRRGIRVIPSVVLIEDSGKTFVGDVAARKLPWQPKMGIAGPSRLLGLVADGPLARSWQSEIVCELGTGDESEVAPMFGNHHVSIEEIVALLLKEVRLSVSAAVEQPVNRVVLTCPTFFGARQRHALRVAGELAGFHVERIVSGPLAVAVELGAGRIRPGRIMVVDCGAGALDVGLIEITPDGYRLVAARGSRDLGGDAYDQLLVSQLAKVTDGLHGAEGLGGYFDIREAAELGKWTLSEQDTAHIEVAHASETPTSEDDAWRLQAEIRRSEAEALFAPLVERSVELCKQVCEDVDWAIDSLDNVVPVGGQARVPLLLQRLRDVFKGALTGIDTQTAVPFGATRIAERIAEGRPLKLREIVPHAISIGRRKGSLDRILSRGEPLPAVAIRNLRIVDEGDLDIFLFEGEAANVGGAEPLARVTLTNLPADLKLPITVEFTVEMSEQGLLRFEAVDRKSRLYIEPMVNAQLTAETIRQRLDLPAAVDDEGAEGSVFAWLLRRLMKDAETVRAR